MFTQWKPISELAADVARQKVKAEDLVKEALRRAEAAKEYKTLLSIADGRALQRAKDIDASIAAGKPAGALAGVPFIAKDNFLTFATTTTAASHILEPFIAPFQATVIERLEAAGAICIGKANLDAFGHGASTENSDFFTTLNPHDKKRVPGGSSGGSAAAVVLAITPFALGTDTGGSSRQPASFVGCFGYKPTYGLMSRYGIVAMGSSTDTVGILASKADDIANALEVMAGKDQLDSTTVDRDKTQYSELDETLKGKKIGLVTEYMGEGLDEGVKKVILAKVAQLKKAGAIVKEVSIPSLPLSLAAYYIVVPAEISSNLSRYDGQRYGFAVDETRDLTDSYLQARSLGFGSEAKRRVMIGTYVLSSGYYDAYYRKAQTVRTKLINDFAIAFSGVDYLVGPTAPTTAFLIGQNSQDPMQMYLVDVMNVGPSLVGIPAISVPAGESNGLPVGMQFMAPQHHDRQLLGIAKAAEQLR